MSSHTLRIGLSALLLTVSASVSPASDSEEDQCTYDGAHSEASEDDDRTDHGASNK